MLEFELSGEVFWVFEGVRYPLEDCLLVVNGNPVESSQDLEDPRGFLRDAKTLEMDIDGQRFPMDWEKLNEGERDMLMEMVSPT